MKTQHNIGTKPYLSNAMQIAYINKPQTPPNGHIKEVIIANSPVSTPMLQAVIALNLPTGIQQQIQDAQVGLSPTANALAQINLAQHTVQQVVNEQISTHLHDTIATNAIDSVVTLINAEGRSNPNADLAWAYMLKGDYTMADSYITTLANDKAFDALARLMRISLAIAQYTGDNYFKYNQSNYAYVQAMATNNYSPYAPIEQAMLKNYDGSTYATLQLLPTVQSTARIANTNTANDSLTTTTTVQDIVGKTMLFSMFPNPATDVVYISLNGSSECNYTISITDVYGKTIGANVPLAEGGKLNYSTNALYNGLYYVQLHCNNVIIGKQKLIINK